MFSKWVVRAEAVFGTSKHYAILVIIVVQETGVASADQQPQKGAQAELLVLVQTVIFFMRFFPSVKLESCADPQEQTLRTLPAFCCLN